MLMKGDYSDNDLLLWGSLVAIEFPKGSRFLSKFPHLFRTHLSGIQYVPGTVLIIAEYNNDHIRKEEKIS